MAILYQIKGMYNLFPGEVAQGNIAKEISWSTSFKLAIFVTILNALFGKGGGNKECSLARQLNTTTCSAEILWALISTGSLMDDEWMWY